MSCVNTFAYDLPAFLANILLPLTGNSDFTVTNSAHFAQLKTRDSKNIFEVWAPQRLGDKILEEDYDFVFNKGLAKSTKTGNFYFKFSLL